MPFSQELIVFFAISQAKNSADALKESEFLLTRAKSSPKNEILIVKNQEVIRVADVLSLNEGEWLTMNMVEILLKEMGGRSRYVEPVCLNFNDCYSLQTKRTRRETVEFTNKAKRLIMNAASSRLIFMPFIDKRHFRLISIDRIEGKVSLYDSGSEKFSGSTFMEENIKIVKLVRSALYNLYKKEFKGEIPHCIQQTNGYSCGIHVIQRAKFLLDTKQNKWDIERTAEELNYFNADAITELNSTLLNIILTKSSYPDNDSNHIYIINRTNPTPSKFVPLSEHLWKDATTFGELKTIFRANNYNNRQMWKTLNKKWRTVGNFLKKTEKHLKSKGDRKHNKKLIRLVQKHDKNFLP